MTTQSYEDVIQDQIWNNGFDACMRNKVKPAKQKIQWVINTLLSAGTDESDECIIELKKALKNLS